MPVASQCRYTNMTNLPWIQIKHIQQKIIRMFDLNTNWLRCSTRKIGNVERHQGFSENDRPQQAHADLFTALHPWNQILISAHQRIGDADFIWRIRLPALSLPMRSPSTRSNSSSTPCDQYGVYSRFSANRKTKSETSAPYNVHVSKNTGNSIRITSESEDYLRCHMD